MESAVKLLEQARTIRLSLLLISLGYIVYVSSLLHNELSGTQFGEALSEATHFLLGLGRFTHFAGCAAIAVTVGLYYFRYKEAFQGFLLIAARGGIIGPSDSQTYSKEETGKILDDFSKDARDLDLLAGRGEFLRSADPQFKQLLTLGRHCRILINDRHSVPLEEISILIKNGVRIRVYEEIKNRVLRGRIKHTESGSKLCVFDKSGDKYRLFASANSVIVESLAARVDDWFNGARNPIVKYILIDLGNVFLKGDFNDFLVEVASRTGKSIDLKSTDYLCANRELNLGTIGITEYLEHICGDEVDPIIMKELQTIWGSTWTSDDEMQLLAAQLSEAKYTLSVVSNCDTDNASKYELHGYLDIFKYRFLSCRLGVLKPDKEFFRIVVDRLNCDPRECLIIDDHLDVVEAAQALGMDAIHVSRLIAPNERASHVRDQLRKRGIVQ